jgi:hypothetical protein
MTCGLQTPQANDRRSLLCSVRMAHDPFLEIVRVFEMVGHSSIDQTCDATGRH